MPAKRFRKAWWGCLAGLLVTSAVAAWYAVYGPDAMLRLKPMLPWLAYQALLRAVHVAVFACWTAAWVPLCRGVTGRRWAVAHVAAPPALAVASELVQVWLPGHVPTVGGAIASLLGVAVGAGLVSARRGGAGPPASGAA